MKKKRELTVFIASVLLFSASLSFPAINLYFSDPYTGIMCLVLGFLGVFQGMIAWLANPLLLVSLVLLLMKKYLMSFLFGIIAISFALTTYQIEELLVGSSGQKEKVTWLGLGFYLWLLSLVIPTIASFVFILEKSNLCNWRKLFKINTP